MIIDDPLLTRHDLAARWHCSRSYIEKRPAADLPPRCSVLPGQYRYRLSDVLRFEASRVDPRHPMGPPPADSTTNASQSLGDSIGSGFPVRLKVTAPSARRRTGRKPVPAIPDTTTP
jgi:hypothetical protein